MFKNDTLNVAPASCMTAGTNSRLSTHMRGRHGSSHAGRHGRNRLLRGLLRHHATGLRRHRTPRGSMEPGGGRPGLTAGQADRSAFAVDAVTTVGQPPPPTHW